MSNIGIIVLTAFTTAIFGIIAMLVGHIVISFIIDPIKMFKTEIGKLSDDLIFYAAVLSNPGHTNHSKAYTAFRKAGTGLQAKSYGIPRYNFLSKLGFLPPRSKLDAACKALISLSNCTGQKDELVLPRIMAKIEENLKIIRESLGIKKPSE